MRKSQLALIHSINDQRTKLLSQHPINTPKVNRINLELEMQLRMYEKKYHKSK